MDMYQKRNMRKKDKENYQNNAENNGKININWYPGHMAKTKRLITEQLNLIDIVYEVIDARIPYSSKIKGLDKIIKNKPHILIITKTDLCDISETNRWIKHYENQGYKVIGFNLEGKVDFRPLFKLTDEMMASNWTKRESKGMIKRKVRALIVGIPNAGKSTLINRLVGQKAVEIGNKPGVTKQLRWIRINNQLELLDTPGILWPKLDEQNVALNLAAFTAIKEEILPIFDISNYILKQLENYYPEKLKERYGIDQLDDDISLSYDIIGHKRGCLVKGGEVDYDKVASIIVNDIKNGYIKHITFDKIQEGEVK